MTPRPTFNGNDDDNPAEPEYRLGRDGANRNMCFKIEIKDEKFLIFQRQEQILTLQVNEAAKEGNVMIRLGTMGSKRLRCQIFLCT